MRMVCNVRTERAEEQQSGQRSHSAEELAAHDSDRGQRGDLADLCSRCSHLGFRLGIDFQDYTLQNVQEEVHR